MKQRLKPCARKQPEHTGCVTACLLKNEPASRGRRRGLAEGEPQRKRVRTGRPMSRRPRTRSRVIYPGAGGSGGETPWTPEPTGVEKPGDDPGVGVKGQSNPEISRSPRNSFRASVARSPPEVEHRMDEGASPPTESNRTPNAGGPERGSQSMWAKLCAREGNSPDRPLRSPSSSRVAKDVRPPRQPGCWLRSSHAFKECVTAHWSSGHAPTIHGAKLDTEAAGF